MKLPKARPVAALPPAQGNPLEPRAYPNYSFTPGILEHDLLGAWPDDHLYQIRLIRYRTVTNQPDQRECSRIQKDSLWGFGFCKLSF